MRMKKRWKTILLSLCMALALISATAFAADTDKAIQLDTGSISGYDSTNGYDYIYYGTWNGNPIQWRVLDDQTNTGNDGLFLLSEELLGTDIYFQQYYHYDYASGIYYKGEEHDGDHTNCQIVYAWQGSDTQAWCKDFAGIEGSSVADAFSDAELNAILETTKSDSGFTGSTDNWYFASENILNNDKVFFLSAEEAENGAYGFTDNDARIAYYDSNVSGWWLRSPNSALTVGIVNSSGRVNAAGVKYAWAVRPAFNLDTSAVLFTSAAEDGKSASGMDTGLAAVSDNTGNEWKLTLLDSGREFKVTETVASGSPGDTIALNYTGAETGANEYISAIVADKADGKVLYYGRVAQPGSTDGSLEITIPTGLTEGSYTLNVFSEQYNGDKKTDYASAFQSVDLTVTASGTGEPDNANIYVGGVELTGSEAAPAYAVTTADGAVTTTDATAENYNIKWDGSTLTLNGATVAQGSCTFFNNRAAAVFCKTSLTIELIGENTVTGPNGDDRNEIDSSYGIYVPDENITITGDGVLNVAGGTVTSINGYIYSYGIGARNVTISSGEVITAGGDGTGDNNIHSLGIDAYGNVSITDGTVTAKGGTVEATGDTTAVTKGAESTGIYAGDVTITGGTLTATGGAATTAGANNSAESYGIDAFDNVSISIGEVTATGGTAEAGGYSAKSYGVNADNVTIESGTVTAKGGATKATSRSAESYGIYSYDKVTVISGTITATGGTAEAGGYFAESYGVNADNVTISSGTVEATGGEARGDSARSYGIFPYALTINGGTVTATGSNNAIYALENVIVSPKEGELIGVKTGENTDAAAQIDGSPFAEETTITDLVTNEKYFHSEAMYTVTVETDGHGTASASPTSAPAGTTINLTATPDSSYRFERWEVVSGDITIENNAFTMPAGNVTVKAIFEKEPGGEDTYYTLTFDTNGGSDIDSVRRISGTTIDLSDYTPTREGYDFTGWYADAELTEKITEIRLTSNKTVYAGWTEQTPQPGVENPFTDVSENDWFYDDVMYLFANRLMNGTSATTFAPYGTTTRAMAVMTIWRMEGEPKAVGANPFTDVESGAWFTEAIIWANENGIALGYGNACFAPDTPVTREQLAAFFYRYAAYKGYDTTVTGSLDRFTDGDNVSEWAKNDVMWAVGYGLMQGDDMNMLNPQIDGIRSEYAAMLHRFIEKSTI